MLKLPRVFPVSLLVVTFLVAAAPARAFGPPPVLNGAELDLALKKLTVLGSALFVAAHPDDENTAMLTWLENERLVRAAYVSMTRGDGGQNLIGDEKGDLLGLIRTQELLAARRIDGAEQYFTRAVDFGYSKNQEETLAIWGRDSVLADLVRVIRTFKPDVIISRFPTTGEGGHGHHTASAILAAEAFEKAGDPAYEVGGLHPWKPGRLFWNRFSWGASPKPEEMAEFLKVDIGAYNPILAKSYSELAADSRSMHKSQGFGSAERRGTLPNYLKLLAGPPAKTDLFDGIDLGWSRLGLAESGRLGTLFQKAYDEFDARQPEKSLPVLLEARTLLEDMNSRGPVMRKLDPNNLPIAPYPDHLVARKLEDLDQVIKSCAGLWLEAIANRAELSPGDSLKVTATAVNRASVPFRLEKVAIAGFGAKDVGQTLDENTSRPAELAFQIPAAFDVLRTQPYWLRNDHGLGLFSVPDSPLIGSPENEPLFEATLTLALDMPEADGGRKHTFEYTIPVVYRWTDRVKGEQYRPVVVLPAAQVHLDEKVYLFPDTAPREVRVTVNSRRPESGTVALTAGQGWKVTPQSQDVTLDGTAPRFVVFLVTPPAGEATADLSAEFTTKAGNPYSRDLVQIDYDHIPRQTLLPPAHARAVRLDVKRQGDRVGYIMGPGDEVAENLRQTGYDVVLLSDQDIESGNLAAFDAIVIGVRAYNTRDALKRRQDRILDYVKGGGTVVVQYNTTDDTLFPKFAPYPLKLGRDRVTVEEAPITFVDPRAPLLNAPNVITARDFDGWVQERGLYFASEWDSTYTPILSSNDPGEKEKTGGLLAARYGKGVFIYTGYAFFRQLPAGVPGAYRLFVNLVSAK